VARSRVIDDGSPSVVVVGPLPPPIHGAARVTAHMVEQLQTAGARVVVVDTSGAADAGPLRYHMARIRSHASAARVALPPPPPPPPGSASGTRRCSS
jgi:hypothetical protein